MANDLWVNDYIWRLVQWWIQCERLPYHLRTFGSSVLKHSNKRRRHSKLSALCSTPVLPTLFSITRSQVGTIKSAHVISHFCPLYTYTWKENYLIISVFIPRDYFTAHSFPHFYCAINLYPVPSAETSFFLPQRLPGSRSPKGHRLQRNPQKQETRLPQSDLKHQNLFPFYRNKACQGILWVGSLYVQQLRRRERLQDFLLGK